MRHQIPSRPWLFLVVTIVFLGIFFRFANLDKKIYWVDEVATSIRISGYTKQEVIQQLSVKDIISIKDLQKYQHPSPEKNLNDTFNALVKSPEHAPLYFLLARFWVQLFGSSLTVTRSLSAVFSLLALPCIYWLCWELFKSPLVGWVAIALSAISPFYVAYAQEARPYSLWTVTILLSSVALLRAIRLNNRFSWGFYTITLVIGLYTSLLSFLVAIGQSIYVLAVEKFHYTKIVKNYLLAFSIGTIAFTPWLIVVILNWQRLQDNTTWMRVPLDVFSMIAIWIYSILIIFVELPIYRYLNPIMIVRIVIDLNLLALVGFSFYFLCLKSSKQVWLFVLTLTIVPTLILIINDLILNGQSSTAPRYLIPYQLGIQLAIAHLLSYKIAHSYLPNNRQHFWKIVLMVLISIGIFSCILSLEKSPKYQKTRNLHNFPIAAIINSAKYPILVAEPEETLDLLSISQVLESRVKIKLLFKTQWNQLLNECKNVFLFNPSSALQDKIQGERILQMKQVYKPDVLIPGEISLSLWIVESLENNCSRQEQENY